MRTRIWPAAPTERRQYSSAPDVNEAFENFDDRADDFFGAALDLDRDDWRQTTGRQHGDVVIASSAQRLEVRRRTESASMNRAG